MKLSEVVPWGRSYNEYCRMFALTDADLRQPILGCGDGPAAFNAHATRMGAGVVSCDPLYRFGAAAIEARVHATADDVVEQARQQYDNFVWRDIASPDALRDLRLDAMRTFLGDYQASRLEPGRPRYVAGALPHLPFADRSFSLVVCSHLLFLYSDHFDEAFHCRALAELCRVGREARVFPLVDLTCEPSPHLAPVLTWLAHRDYDVEVVGVDYEFQRGGNQMLRIRPPAAAPPVKEPP